MLLRRTNTPARRAPAAPCEPRRSISISISISISRRRASLSCSRAATSSDQHQQPPPQQQQQAYPYQSPEGRNKATIEHVFFTPASDGGDDEEGDAASGLPTAAAAATEHRRHRRSALGALDQTPWRIGWQMSERNIVWNDQLKLRLIKHAAAKTLGLQPKELERSLALLTPLLPRSLGSLLARASAETCVKLADNADVVASRLLHLKALFPRADVEAMVSARLSLLLDEDLGDVAAAREALAGRVLAGPTGVCVDRFVEAFPVVLSARGAEFERAVEDAFRLLPSLQRFSQGARDPEGAAALATLLRRDPEQVVGLMKGSCLITYDQVSNPFTPRGGMAVNPPGTPG